VALVHRYEPRRLRSASREHEAQRSSEFLGVPAHRTEAVLAEERRVGRAWADDYLESPLADDDVAAPRQESGRNFRCTKANLLRCRLGTHCSASRKVLPRWTVRFR
jgi:hypothetical protein